MFKITNQIVNFIARTRGKWRVEQAFGRPTLAVIKIQRGIFQGNSLSPLLFCNSNDAIQLYKEMAKGTTDLQGNKKNKPHLYRY